MYSILNRVKNQRNEARKSKDKVQYNFCTVLLGEFERNDKQIKDENALKVIQSMIKKMSEDLDKLSDQDHHKTLHEIEFLKQYLPDEVEEEVMIDFANQYDSLGKFMAALNGYSKQNSLICDNQKARNIYEGVNK